MEGISSPDGRFRAYALRWSGGGATVGTVYGVIISETASPIHFGSKFDCDWEAYGVAVKYLFWRADGALEVVVSNEDRYDFANIRVTPRKGIPVVTTVMKDPTKDAVFSASELQVPVTVPKE